jgi:hypothetical protein
MKQGLGLAATFLFIITGCSHSVLHKPPKIELPSLAEWPTYYRQNFSRLESMQSKARITVESSEMSSHFTTNMMYSAPDVLFLEAGGPLGIDFGKFFIGKQRFILYNQYENQFLCGSLDETYYNTFLQTSLTFSQIKNAFIGYVQLPDNLVLADDRHGIFTALIAGGRWRFVVDPNSGTLQSWEIQQNGQVVFKEEFKSYRGIDNVVIPGFVRIVNPLKPELLSVFHTDVKVNETIKPDAYHIVISPKVKQLMIRE